MKNSTFVDLFSGIGGFRLGMEKAGFRCVFSVEINKHCQEVYRKNFKDTPETDITKIPLSRIPKHEVLTAGFPCQSFSICGKRKGFEDKRGNLFFRICEIIQSKQPKLIFLENVKYLIYHNNGETLRQMVSSLCELGYYVNFKILNSLHFGMPQNRERIIIICSKLKKFNFDQLSYKLENIRLLDFLDKKGDFEYLNKKEYTLIKKTYPKKIFWTYFYRI